MSDIQQAKIIQLLGGINKSVKEQNDLSTLTPTAASPSADFGTLVALGLVANYTSGTKFGRNPDIDTGTTPEDMWNGGSIYTGQPENFTPETMEVYSNSVLDTNAGTGARTVRLYGLESPTSETYTTEDIILNGTTKVTTVKTWWRLNRVIVLTAGSTGSNQDVITVEATSDALKVFVKMPVNLNQTTIAAYTVPYNCKLIIKSIAGSIVRASGAAGSATVTFKVKPTGGVYNVKRVIEMQTGAIYTGEQLGFVINAGSDVKFTIEDVSDNGTVAQASMQYYLISN